MPEGICELYIAERGSPNTDIVLPNGPDGPLGGEDGNNINDGVDPNVTTPEDDDTTPTDDPTIPSDDQETPADDVTTPEDD